MFKPFVLTLANFKASALAAIAEERIVLQHPNMLKDFVEEPHGNQDCMNVYPADYFDGKELNCIVGCALPKDLAKKYADDDLHALYNMGIIDVSHTDLTTIGKFQLRHDMLASRSATRLDRDWVADRDEFFADVAAIDVDVSS